MEIIQRIIEIADQLAEKAKFSSAELEKLRDSAETIGKSWSGSWLGYQSCVYFKDFKLPPPGAHFSQEWGLMTDAMHKSTGGWKEYNFDDVISKIYDQADNPDLTTIISESKDTRDFIGECRNEILSLTSTDTNSGNDKFFAKLINEIDDLKVFSGSEYLKNISPGGQMMSRDIHAIEGGISTPPHLTIVAKIFEINSPYSACAEMAKKAQHLGSHLKNMSKSKVTVSAKGTNVFIGHGGSSDWRELKEFIESRLNLQSDEFNRVPVAGVSNTERLSEMLENAACAFLVMTAEDEQQDGNINARMNVIHEVGLFQGRLGFDKAIVLLEEGCQEFSNIQGLGQIRFQAGKISAIFENVRQILERERLIS